MFSVKKNIRCRVVTRLRGEGRDHGGLGPGREGDEMPILFGPVLLLAALTRRSSGASHEQQNKREREREREREIKLAYINILCMYRGCYNAA